MTNTESAETLRTMVGQDHFTTNVGGFYSSVSNPTQKAMLNASVDATAQALADAASSNADTPRLLAILKEHLEGIDRHSLDTENAEHVAIVFEQMLDALGIGSSEGILNEWLYGFDPT